MEASSKVCPWGRGICGSHFQATLEGCLVRAAYTKASGKDRVKLSSLHGSGNVSYYKQGNKVITIPSLHGSGNEGMGKISESIY